MVLNVSLKDCSYEIIFDKGGINRVDRYFNLNRKVLIFTDTGVPYDYIRTVRILCKEASVFCFDKGEKNKNFSTYCCALEKLINDHFTRKDCIIAVGGGVVGDIAGFVASSYMRGIDFYNIPTTSLAQIDASIGGKTAINFNGIKNIVGAFYQPKKVLIDTDLLKTLPNRQFNNGIAEAVKMSVTSDRGLFEFIKNCDIKAKIDNIIFRALSIKKSIVEKDEKENNIRKILNFGHTVGHAIESLQASSGLYHGECVSIGMLVFSSDIVKNELKEVLLHLNLPTTIDNIYINRVCKLVYCDKKSNGDTIDIVAVDRVGKCKIKTVSYNYIREKVELLLK